jgi:hypothetical protein
VNSSLIPDFPFLPCSIEDTGLSLEFLVDLTLKVVYTHGESVHMRDFSLGYEIADALKLPFANVVEKTLDALRQERLVEITGSVGISASSYRYVISNLGRMRVRELMGQNQYAGAAPVSLAAYTQMVNRQSIPEVVFTQEDLKRALFALVLSDTTLNRLGPAINSGRSIFLFGNTGNGKTSIGLAIGAALPGAIWVPYAIAVDRQIIKVFDARHHRLIPLKHTSETPLPSKGLLAHLSHESVIRDESPLLSADTHYDERWALVHRPLIVGGGEMTMRHLEPVFDPATKYFEAPHQMKANGGIFLIDDLGRQPVSSREILNRWVAPLERRVDILNLTMGRKIDVPFDALIIFATNLKPEDLVDESFLRRLRYKINIPDPTWEEYREIFKREAAKRNIEYSDQALQYIIKEYYFKPERSPRGVHSRDILDALIDVAHFTKVPAILSKDLMDRACQSYFLKETV